jgi:hypothetical protein
MQVIRGSWSRTCKQHGKGLGRAIRYSRSNDVLVKKNNWQTQHVMVEVVICPFVDNVCWTCCQDLWQAVVARSPFTFHSRVGQRSVNVWSPCQRACDAWVATPDLHKPHDESGKYWGPCGHWLRNARVQPVIQTVKSPCSVRLIWLVYEPHHTEWHFVQTSTSCDKTKGSCQQYSRKHVFGNLCLTFYIF